MKRLLLLLFVVLLSVLSTSAQAQNVQNVSLLSLDRLTGAVGFDYVVQVDAPGDKVWAPKAGVILAYRLTKSISVGAQGWVLADDLKAPKEIRMVVRWRVF